MKTTNIINTYTSDKTLMPKTSAYNLTESNQELMLLLENALVIAKAMLAESTARRNHLEEVLP